MVLITLLAIGVYHIAHIDRSLQAISASLQTFQVNLEN